MIYNTNYGIAASLINCWIIGVNNMVAYTENFKEQEIKDHIKNFIDDYIGYGIDIDDLHHEMFNTGYYIIGTWKATQWLGQEAFNVINFIKEWEQDNFGECNTDLSDPERVVNMYVYIIGQDLIGLAYDDLELIINEKVKGKKKEVLINNLFK